MQEPLCDPRLSPVEAMLACGFADQSHFGTAFRRLGENDVVDRRGGALPDRAWSSAQR